MGRVFPIVIWPEFRIRQYGDHDHREDALHFTVILKLIRYNLDLGNEVKPVIRLADTVEVSSLEKTGSKLGHRYKKATRAKDISNATAKDMEVIIEIKGSCRS